MSAGQSDMDGWGSGLTVGVINERLAGVWACGCDSVGRVFNPQQHINQVCCCVPVVPACRRRRQEDDQFVVVLE